MKLNEQDEVILKYLINAKGRNNYVDHEKLKIPTSISQEQIDESMSVLITSGLVKQFSKDYLYRIEPEGLRYFGEKLAHQKEETKSHLIYPVLVNILSALGGIIIGAIATYLKMK